MKPASGIVEPGTAVKLGFPQLSYAGVERERKWLCRAVPLDRVLHATRITDIYMEGSRLRLREALPAEGGPARRRLSRKADIDSSHRLMTSIYLSAEEFALFRNLPGRAINKMRHHLGPVHGVQLSVDTFEDALEGLILAEAEFDDDQSMAAYPHPDFAVREVTDDPRYTGGSLAVNGIPAETELR